MISNKLKLYAKLCQIRQKTVYLCVHYLFNIILYLGYFKDLKMATMFEWEHYAGEFRFMTLKVIGIFPRKIRSLSYFID